MGDITVVLGPPCAGKSTYVREHASPGDVIVDYDALATAFGSPSPHDAPEDIANLAFAARRTAVVKILAGLDSASWVIHTAPAGWQMSSYQGAGASFVALDPGIDECLARAAADGRPERTEQVIRDWYDAPPQVPDGKARRMKIKQFDTKVKAAGSDDGLEEGQFRAVVSVFNNIDSVGDVVLPGAFADDLEQWKNSDGVLPVVWSHDWGNPHAHIGHVLEAKETDEGLEVLGQLDEDDLEDRQSLTSKVHRLLKGRRVVAFSFAYDILDAGWGERDGREVYELKKLKVHEVGPTLVGANDEAHLIAAKAHDIAARLKAGDTIDLDQLTGAYDALGAVIEATKSPAPSGAGTTKREAGQPDPDPANDPAAPGTSAEQPSKVSPAQVAAWTTLKEIA